MGKARIHEQQDLCSWNSLKSLVLGVLVAEYNAADCAVGPASIAEASQLLFEAAELAYRISESERTVEVRSGNAASAREAKAKQSGHPELIDENAVKLAATLRCRRSIPTTRAFLTRNANRIMTDSQLDAVLEAWGEPTSLRPIPQVAAVCAAASSTCSRHIHRPDGVPITSSNRGMGASGEFQGKIAKIWLRLAPQMLIFLRSAS